MDKIEIRLDRNTSHMKAGRDYLVMYKDHHSKEKKLVSAVWKDGGFDFHQSSFLNGGKNPTLTKQKNVDYIIGWCCLVTWEKVVINGDDKNGGDCDENSMV